jgi:glycosyltransferase involved in cell wall biosynthesis
VRVLLLNYEYPPVGGGAGQATAELARRLAARGETVHVVTAGAAPADAIVARGQPAGPGTGEPHVHRVRSRRRGVHHAGYGGAWGYLVRALPVVRRLSRRHPFDLVHVFFSLPTGALIPVAGLGDVPLVVSLRGSDVPGYDPRLTRLHGALRPLTRRIWRRADRVVAVSDELGRLARDALPDLPYSVTHNGVDLELFHPAAPAPPERGGPLRCLAVARLVERKGLEELLLALSRLERGRAQLEIVGSGPREPLLRKLTKRLGLDDRVRFVGPLGRPAVAERYRHADLFTLTPRQEAFGNVFAEALASGVPIVATRSGGTPEIVTHGENGLLVPPRDPAATAAAIDCLARDPQLRAAMARRNRARAEASLSWETAAQRYLDLYRELLRSRTRRPRPAAAPA